jgi:hypothetical protein
VAIEGDHLPTEVGYDARLQSGQDPGEDDETVADGFLHRNTLVEETQNFITCLSGWSQMILQVKKPDMEVLGWCGYTSCAVMRPVGRNAKFSKTTLKAVYSREINIQSSGNSSGGHSCSQHDNCMFPQNLRHLWHCVV